MPIFHVEVPEVYNAVYKVEAKDGEEAEKLFGLEGEFLFNEYSRTLDSPIHVTEVKKS